MKRKIKLTIELYDLAELAFNQADEDYLSALKADVTSLFHAEEDYEVIKVDVESCFDVSRHGKLTPKRTKRTLLEDLNKLTTKDFPNEEEFKKKI